MNVSESQEEFAVEDENIPAGSLTGIIAAIVAMVIMTVVLAVNISTLKFEEARKASIDHTGYPMLEATRTSAEQKLNSSGPVMGEEGVYQIPIDQAMELVVSESEGN